MDLARRLAAFEHADLYVVITEAFCAGRTALIVLDQVLAAGATAFLPKPFDETELLTLVRRVLAQADVAGEDPTP